VTPALPRMAEAIRAALESGGDHRAAARAALVVLHEPSAAMMAPACREHAPGKPMGPGKGECPFIARRRQAWRAIIDIALDEDGSGEEGAPVPVEPSRGGGAMAGAEAEA
jgi:hypothetical protein